ncbi:unnamed protein product, partial [Prorocentrum cordatum]
DASSGSQFGASQLLGSSSTAEDRARLLRRVEMCAKAREESTKIMSQRFAQRDAVKMETRREQRRLAEEFLKNQRARDERWSRKLQRSPFAVDLVAENQRIDEDNRVRDHVDQRRQRLMERQSREAHNSIFKRITAETQTTSSRGSAARSGCCSRTSGSSRRRRAGDERRRRASAGAAAAAVPQRAGRGDDEPGGLVGPQVVEGRQGSP